MCTNLNVNQVDHIDYQTQVFDNRKKSGFGRPPDILFGARAANGVPNRRHSRGDTNLSLYAKGFPDGTVKIWDYRNAKVRNLVAIEIWQVLTSSGLTIKNPLIYQSFQRPSKVTHTIFTDPSTLLCYSDRELVSIDLNQASAG